MITLSNVEPHALWMEESGYPEYLWIILLSLVDAAVPPALILMATGTFLASRMMDETFEGS